MEAAGLEASLVMSNTSVTSLSQAASTCCYTQGDMIPADVSDFSRLGCLGCPQAQQIQV